MRTKISTMALLLAVAGCRGSVAAALVDVAAEPEGANCTYGGSAVSSGLDANENGALDADEVTDTAYICNGAPGEQGEQGEQGDPGEGGATAMIRVDEELAGENCEFGGLAVNAGNDFDYSGTLEDTEISSTYYVCDGPPGEAGEAGEAGASGAAALIRIDDEAAGDNCANGGSAVKSGVDDDGDGSLADGEVDVTRYICDGAPGEAGEGGAAALVRLDDELPGSNCEMGGTAVKAGLDLDANGALDDDEVSFTSYVCSSWTDLATPMAWSVQGYNSVTHTAKTTYTTIPDLQLDFELGEDYVVLVQFDLTFVGASGTFVGTRLNIDGTADTTWTHTQPMGSADEEDHLHLFRVAELSAGAHTIKAEWGDGNGTVSNLAGDPNNYHVRKLSAVAIPKSWGVQAEQVQGVNNECHGSTPGSFQKIPEMEIKFDLSEESIVLSEFDINVVGAANNWVATRLKMDGKTNGGTHTHPQGGPDEDDHLHLFNIDVLPAGAHTLIAEWGEGAGTMCNNPKTAKFWDRRLGYLAIPVKTGALSKLSVPKQAVSRAPGAFAAVPGLAYDLNLPGPSQWVSLTEMDLTYYSNAAGGWTATRLQIDGVPEARATHSNPNVAGEDDHLHNHSVNVMSAGPHSFEGQWGLGGGTANTDSTVGSYGGMVWTQRLGTIAIPMIAETE